MKRSVKVLSGLTAFILIGGILWFANGFLGNPISKAIATNSLSKYIGENYSDMKLEVSDINYSFKDGNYHGYVKSPTSKDTYFTVNISPLGRVKYDSYEDKVIKRYNTYERINELYNSEVKKVLESDNFPYDIDIYFGELQQKDLSNGFGPKYGLDISELELDKEYNMDDLGKSYGHIILYVEDEDVSMNRASEILIDVKNILDNKNIEFYAIDFTLEKPLKEGISINNEKSISVQQFLYEDIYEKELIERMEKAAYNLQQYYKEQDEIKAKEIEQIEGEK